MQHGKLANTCQLYAAGQRTLVFIHATHFITVNSVPFEISKAEPAAAALILLVEDPVYDCLSIPARQGMSTLIRAWLPAALPLDKS